MCTCFADCELDKGGFMASREKFAPAFVFTPRLCQEGARVRVECQVRAKPTPVARWYLNDVDLAQSPHTAYLTCQPLDDNCFLLRMLIDQVSKKVGIVPRHRPQHRRRSDGLYQPRL